MKEWVLAHPALAAGAAAASLLLGHLLGRFKGRPLAGTLLGLLGPPGWLWTLFAFGGTVRCPSCRRRTPYAPAPSLPPGASTPHLRCRRCGEIVWGV